VWHEQAFGTGCISVGIVEFDSIDDAEIAGFNARSIRDCFIGKQKTHAGYTWEKITDAEDRQKARGKAALQG